MYAPLPTNALTKRLASLAVVLMLAPISFAQTELPYEVVIVGAGTLESTLRAASTLIALEDQPPESLEILKSRIDRDMPRLKQFMDAEGYYGATITPEIDRKTTPVQVTLNVDLGPQFTISDTAIDITDGADAARERVPDGSTLELEEGALARASAILKARDNLLAQMRKKGLAFAAIAAPDVTVDHATQKVSVVFHVKPGPVSQFGRITVTGNEKIEADFIRHKARWGYGDPYDVTLIDDLRKQLRESGLFSIVQISIPEQATEDGFVPVTIDVTERKHRTISAGASYTTDQGAGVHVAWENRNMAARGQRLKLDAIVSQQQDSFEAQYAIPDFKRPRQMLQLKARVALDDTDAFESRSVSLGANIDRELSKRLRVGLGLTLKASNVDQLDDEIHSRLVSVPAYLIYDGSDDLLDPTRGGRLRLDLAPFHDFAQKVTFGRARVGYSHYLKVMEDPRLVLAGRITLGAMEGADWDEIPPDERFYAGGGGSIRGYPYQTVGPLSDDDPLGGRSLFEVSGEFRLRVSERFGVVAFLDGGSAFRSSVPDFSESVLWGAGIGGRYFSPIGPIRLDVAVPLNRREEVDDAFQIYVSLGQAF